VDVDKEWSTHSQDDKEDGTTIIKKPEEFNSEDYKMMEKNA